MSQILTHQNTDTQKPDNSKCWTTHSKFLRHLLTHGEHPDVFVFHGWHRNWGNAIDAADKFTPVDVYRRAALYLPYGYCPSSLAWPVQDCEVMCHLAEMDERTELQLATQLLIGGALVVRSILHYGEHSRMAIFDPDYLELAA